MDSVIRKFWNRLLRPFGCVSIDSGFALDTGTMFPVDRNRQVMPVFSKLLSPGEWKMFALHCAFEGQMHAASTGAG